MIFPVTFTGQMTFQDYGDSSVVTNFMKLVERDLEMAKADKVIRSLSVDGKSATFELMPVSKRIFSHPIGYLFLYNYPKQYREIVTAVATLSSATVSVTTDSPIIVLTYNLDFSEVFKWALYGFATSLFLGSFALAWETRLPILLAGIGVLIVLIFGYYSLGQVIPFIFLFRRYLKKRMDESQKRSILFDGRRRGNE